MLYEALDEDKISAFTELTLMMEINNKHKQVNI